MRRQAGKALSTQGTEEPPGLFPEILGRSLAKLEQLFEAALPAQARLVRGLHLVAVFAQAPPIPSHVGIPYPAL